MIYQKYQLVICIVKISMNSSQNSQESNPLQTGYPVPVYGVYRVYRMHRVLYRTQTNLTEHNVT